VAEVDLVAAPIETPPRVDTPPLQRVAPAYQEPSSPDTSCVQLKGFEGLFGMDSITNLKRGCSTPPWPARLTKANLPASTIRVHSYALRDIETELETLNADLQTPVQRSAKVHFASEVTDQSFQDWRAALLKDVPK
jgi:hypothetical protein